MRPVARRSIFVAIFALVASTRCVVPVASGDDLPAPAAAPVALAEAGEPVLSIAPAPPHAAPGVEILYVPVADLARSPEVGASGVSLPLASLLELAREATAARNSPTAPRPASVESLSLSGSFGIEGGSGALSLAGELRFVAEDDAWSAVPVDSGAIPWTSQRLSIEESSADPSRPPVAFLARVPELADSPDWAAPRGDAPAPTFLFARGPARGSIALEALAPSAGAPSRPEFVLGALHVPASIAIDLPPGYVAVRPIRYVGAATEEPLPDGGTRLRLTAATNVSVSLALAARPIVEAPAAPRVEYARQVSEADGRLSVADALLFVDRFTTASVVRVGLPEGLVPLRFEPGADVSIAREGNELAISVLAPTNHFHIEAEFDLPAIDGAATLSPWRIDSADLRGRIAFAASDRRRVVPLDEPPALVRDASDPNVRHAVGALGPLRLAVVSLDPAESLRASRTYVEIERGRADARCEIEIPRSADAAGPFEILADLPEGWLPTAVSAIPETEPPPVARPLRGTRWRIASATRPASLTLHMRRLGAWGNAGAVEDLALPVVGFDRPVDRSVWRIAAPPSIEVDPASLVSLKRVSIADAGIAAPPSIEVDPASLVSLKRVSVADAGVADASGNLAPDDAVHGDFALAAIGTDPSGLLRIRGKEADLRTTLVALASIGEERTAIRVLLRHDVRFAPIGDFRFVLPPGTGPAVKIDGAGIRETSRVETPAGDAWTVSLQTPTTGEVDLTLEWTIDPARTPHGTPPDAATKLFALPRVDVPDATSLRAFVLLEGEGALGLEPRPVRLAEIAPSEAPPLPWPRAARTLAAYRSVDPDWSLAVAARRYEPEPVPPGIVREARLTTTVAPEGARFTRGEYRVAMSRDRQYFDLALPPRAVVWSARVDGVGVKPARRTAEGGASILMIPLSDAGGSDRETSVEVVYRESGEPLDSIRRLEVAGPKLFVPTDRTIWDLNLPAGYEYLAYGGDMTRPAAAHPSILATLLDAYWPRRLVFRGASEVALGIWAAILAFGALAVFRVRDFLASKISRDGRPRTLGPWGCILILAGAAAVSGSIVAVVRGVARTQTRVAVNRARILQHRVEGRIEAFRRDRGRLPESLDELWQGAVKYLDGPPLDPFAGGTGDSGTALQYATGTSAYDAAVEAGFPLPPEARVPGFWIVYSIGPDGRDDGGRIDYDIAQGKSGFGDLVWPLGGRGMKDAISGDWRSRLPSYKAAPLRQVDWSALHPERPTTVGFAYRPDANPMPQGQVVAPEDDRVQADGMFRRQALADVRSSLEDAVRSLPEKKEGFEEAQASAPAREMQTRIEQAPAVAEEPSFNAAPSADAPMPESLPMPQSPPPPPPAETEQATTALTDEKDRAGRSVDTYRDKSKWEDRGSGAPEEERLGERGAGAGASFAAGGPVAQTASASSDGSARAGLLSLALRIPEGGVQKRFESLDGRADVEVRLMERDRWLRLRFLAWFGVFLAIGGLRLRSARAYRVGLLVAAAATLLPAPLLDGPSVAFLNAAFAGAAASLLVPLSLALWSRVAGAPRDSVARTAPSLAWFALALGAATFAASPSRAEERTDAPEAPAPASIALPTDGAPPPPPPPPARIFVPYSGDPSAIDPANVDRPAFVNRDVFERLWEAARRTPTPRVAPPSALIELRMEGRFDPDSGAVEGALSIRAANPSSAVAEIPLALSDLEPTCPAASNPPGAPIDRSPDGALRLRLPPEWSGEIELPFRLACRSTGADGSLSLAFPEAASGLWRVWLPNDVSVVDGLDGSPAPLSRVAFGRTAVFGPVRAGRLAFAWRGARGAASDSAPARPHAKVRIDARWQALRAANLQVAIDLSAGREGESLPVRYELTLPEGFRLLGARGEHLRSARVEGARLLLETSPTESATVVLDATLDPESASPEGGAEWRIAAPSFVESPATPAPAASATIRVEWDPARAEVVSIEPTNLSARGGDSPAARTYEGEADGALAVALRPPSVRFAATVREAVVPREGRLERFAEIVAEPRAGELREIRFALPLGASLFEIPGNPKILRLDAGGLHMAEFAESIAPGAVARFELRFSEPLGTATDSLRAAPVRIVGSAETARSIAVAIPADLTASETDVADAKARARDDGDERCVARLAPASEIPRDSIRAYEIRSDAPLLFSLAPAPDAATVVVANRVEFSDGLRKLDALARAEPRRGRIDAIRARLLLPEPDPTVGARVESSGPVRRLRVERVSDLEYAVVAELASPSESPVEIRLGVSSATRVEDGATLGAPILLPEAGPAARAFLLARRGFDGELALADPASARPADGAAIAWPAPDFAPVPADLVLELSPAAPSVPTFRATRHARVDALRAVAELVYERVVLSADGVERHELDVAIQNRSEQFLLVALPHPRDRVELYRTVVGGRIAKASFVEHEGREALQIPLPRTGLLDPELLVRVAYVARTDALSGSGRREHALPEILGGVPVLESRLLLMLPSDYSYDDFDGTLEETPLVNLELAEAERRSKALERRTEALLGADASVQAAGLVELRKELAANEARLDLARRSSLSYEANLAKTKAGKKAATTEQEADDGRLRSETMENAGASQMQAFENVRRLDEIARSNMADTFSAAAAPAPAPVPPEESATPHEFPRSGESFAFRQIQSVGSVSFRYARRDGGELRAQLALGVGLLVALALALARGSAVATPRRVGYALLAICLSGIAAGVATDAAIPLTGVAIAILWRNRSATPPTPPRNRPAHSTR